MLVTIILQKYTNTYLHLKVFFQKKKEHPQIPQNKTGSPEMIDY